MGSVPLNEGTSIAVAKGVCEAKGHNAHWPNGDLEKQDGHVIYHDHVKGMYELLVVSKPKAIGTTSLAMSKALSSSAGAPSAISGIGVTSQFRYMSSNSTTIWKSLALMIIAELVPKTQLRKQMM